MSQTSEPPTFTQAFHVFLRIGLLSFGGPAGQIALMHRELVEKRDWVGETTSFTLSISVTCYRGRKRSNWRLG